MRLSVDQHARVSAAVAAAEANTSGEIVAIAAGNSDAYHDVALHWAMLAMLLVVALVAAVPQCAVDLLDRITGRWGAEWSLSQLASILLATLALTFLLARLATLPMALRMLLTPGATKTRRVRRRALAMFRAAIEGRTHGSTGVLIYLSLDEHRAEIIADAGIHEKVPAEFWADAMAALLAATRDGRPGDGMADAIGLIAGPLAEHFPRGHDDRNELPDRLIEL
jgi:putative membrane protein